MKEFNPKEYDDVQTRLEEFQVDYPEAVIITDMVKNADDMSFVIFKAIAYRSTGAALKGEVWATGHAEERRSQSITDVNYTSHVENCETSAIGRVLANLGYHGSKRPSLQEMEKVERLKGQFKGDEVHPGDEMQTASTSQPKSKFSIPFKWNFDELVDELLAMQPNDIQDYEAFVRQNGKFASDAQQKAIMSIFTRAKKGTLEKKK